MHKKDHLATIRSQLSDLETTLKKKSIKLNPSVLEDSSSDSECCKEDMGQATNSISQWKGTSLEETMMRVREKYLKNRSANEEWYNEEIKKLYRMYKLN